MKTLKTLIKLSKQDLDAKRLELNVFLDKKDELLGKNAALQKDLSEEQKFATDSDEFKYAYTSFSVNISYQQENNNNFIKALNERIELVSRQISDAFAELKKYEIMLDKKVKEMQKEIARKEVIELDEIGLIAHVRKGNKK